MPLVFVLPSPLLSVLICNLSMVKIVIYCLISSLKIESFNCPLVLLKYNFKTSNFLCIRYGVQLECNYYLKKHINIESEEASLMFNWQDKWLYCCIAWGLREKAKRPSLHLWKPAVKLIVHQIKLHQVDKLTDRWPTAAVLFSFQR